MPFYPKKNKKSTKKAKKVKTTPKKVSSVVKLQKQINALTLTMNKEKEIKEIDLGILENSVSQVNGTGVGAAPTNAYGVGQLSNTTSGLSIANGTGPAQRIGNFVNLKRMKWRCQIQNQLGCVSPMKLRLEIWQLIGDPDGTSLMSPQTLVSQVYLPNQFYLVAQGSSPPYGPAKIYDTTSLKNPQYNIGNIAKKIFTKKMYVPQEQFNSGIEIRDYNFNVDLKNMRTGFNDDDTLQCQYYYFIFANTGNSSVINVVDPSYTKGLGSYAVNSGTRFNASVRIEYLDD